MLRNALKPEQLTQYIRRAPTESLVVLRAQYEEKLSLLSLYTHLISPITFAISVGLVCWSAVTFHRQPKQATLTALGGLSLFAKVAQDRSEWADLSRESSQIEEELATRQVRIP